MPIFHTFWLAFDANADLDADPGYQNDADPDPQHCLTKRKNRLCILDHKLTDSCLTPPLY
jgi:hypothetical protein